MNPIVLCFAGWGSGCELSSLIGRTMVRVEQSTDREMITFEDTDGNVFEMYHDQDCCEHVSVEDINGDLSDLVGSPILTAEEETSGENPPGYTPGEYQDSFTWTFYKLSTNKGTVTIRWYGESNGYYGEGVDLHIAKRAEDVKEQ